MVMHIQTICQQQETHKIARHFHIKREISRNTREGVPTDFPAPAK